MIKLQLHIGEKVQKVIVDLVTEQQPTILSFLKRVVDICGFDDISANDLEIFDEDYILPHQLPSRCVTESKVYVIHLKEKNKKQRMKNKKQSKKTKQIVNKKPITKVSSSESQSQESSSSSQSQQIPNQIPNQIKPNQIANAPKLYQKRIKQTANSLSPPSQTKRIPIKIIKFVPKSNLHQVSSQSSLSSSEEQSSPLPQIPQKVKNAIQSKPPNKNITPPVEKNIKNKQSKIQQDSSSQQSSIKHQQYKAKVKEILANVSKPSQNQSKPPISQANKQKPTNTFKKPTNVPISVRNKQNQQPNKPQTNPPKPIQQLVKKQVNKMPKQYGLSFKQHQEMRWIPITKDVIKQWAIANTEAPIIQQKNEIRFKIMELDEEKFIPVTSGWIAGFVNGVEKKDTSLIIRLENVTKNDKDQGNKPQFLKSYQVPMHNMQELQINKNTLNKQQQTIIKGNQSQKEQRSIQKPEQIHKQEKPATNTSPKDNQKPVQSLQQFICGQIHYYFSDKNYLTDLFMQMHANQDPSKYIDIKLFLNFQKIRKVLTNQAKLWEILTTDEKYPSRNYELDLERKMIRKK